MDITELKEYEHILSISPSRSSHSKNDDRPTPIKINDSPLIEQISLYLPELIKSVKKSSFDVVESSSESPETIVNEIINELFEKIFPIKKSLTTIVFDSDKSINTSEFNRNERPSIRIAPSRLTHSIRVSNSVCINKSDDQFLIPEPSTDEIEKLEVKVIV